MMPLLKLGLPMPVPKWKVQRTEDTYVSPRGASFWRGLISVGIVHPSTPVPLKSTESLEGKTSSCLFSPFNCSQLMPGYRHEYPWTMLVSISVRISVFPGGSRQAGIRAACRLGISHDYDALPNGSDRPLGPQRIWSPVGRECFRRQLKRKPSDGNGYAFTANGC